MKLGTKSRYSTRAMLDLAVNYADGTSVVSARKIAEHQDVSPKYLESLLAALRSAGLIRSVRGLEGEYTLTRHPSRINLQEIYHVFEGTEGFVECTTEPAYCTRTDGCVTRDIWAQMYDASMEILRSTTLEDVTRRAREKLDEPATTRCPAQ